MREDPFHQCLHAWDLDNVSPTTAKIGKCAVFWIQITDYELLWSLLRLLETAVVGWRFRMKAVCYTCQLSRLRRESHACRLKTLRCHACGPISHAWLKNVSSCHLAWHNFQKYVNSDSCKERKPCEKWINDNTFLAILIFEVRNTGGELTFIRVLRLRKTSDVFGRLRTSSEDFRLLRNT